MSAPITTSVENYRVAWISALPIERASASQMLDEVYEEPADFDRNEQDKNSYSWGRIHGHNIVLTSLPVASYGKVNAANCVAELLSSLPQIKFGLMVGIGAGLPNEQNDIRLGDVIVSQPDKSHGGVIQYDLGKARAGGIWEPKGFLNPPPPVLLNALANVQSEHECGHFLSVKFLDEAMKRNTYWGANYAYPVGQVDRFFRSEELPDHDAAVIRTVESELIRPARPSRDPKIHYGTIASGDTLVKDEITRNTIPEKVKETCLCIEMEAAGLVNKFPCIVIRGICDYADSHKNDHWQRYASATAAAFAKELLYYTPLSEVKRSLSAVESVKPQAAFTLLTNQFAKAEQKLEKQKVDEFLKDLYTCPYAQRKDRNIEALDGTCQWFIKNPRFVSFMQDPAAKLLWISADPGCGKSVLSKYLIDKVLNVNKDKIICYFFFKDDFSDQNRCAQAMSAMLRQLVNADPGALKQDILDKYARSGKKYMESFDDLWQDFLKTASNSASKSIICVFDALDECQTEDRRMLIKAINKWHRETPTSSLKMLATSRPYRDIKDDFHELVASYPSIHLSGENESEAKEISKEIDIVLRHRIRLLCIKRSLSSKEETILIDKFVSTPQRTYLWAHLTMNLVETTPGLTAGRIKEVTADLPSNVEQAYEKILDRSEDHIKTKIVLHILLAVKRPITVEEASIVLSLTGNQKHSRDLEDYVEPPERFRHSIRDLCGLFVTILDNRVYFLHQTAREFLSQQIGFEDQFRSMKSPESHRLNWCNSLNHAESHATLAKRCLRYLSIADASSYHEAFFEYCSHYWILHFREGETTMVPQQVALPMNIIRHWSSNYWLLPDNIQEDHHLMEIISESVERSIPTIFFPSWFGVSSILQALLECDPTIRDREDVMYSALCLACQAGNIDAAKILLKHGAVIYLRNGHLLRSCQQGKPLVMAFLTSNMDLSYLLLQHDSAILAVNEDVGWGKDNHKCGETPFHYAVPGLGPQKLPKPFGLHEERYRTYDTRIIQTLLELGANVKARTQTGAMPIHYFLSNARRILNRNDKNSVDSELTSLTSLHTVMKLLLPLGFDVNEHDDVAGASLMRFAAWAGSAKLIQVMLMMGGSIHIQDQAGNNLLHHAAMAWYDGGAVDLALSKGIDIESRNNDGLTPLLLATACGSYGPLRVLINFGASTEARDRMEKTSLMYSVDGHNMVSPIDGTWLGLSGENSLAHRTAYWLVTRCLIRAGANINAKDVSGNAFIHYAALNDNVDYYLIRLPEALTDVNLTNCDGRTALHLIARQPIEEVSPMKERMQFFLEHSADPSIIDNDGRTACWYIEEQLRNLGQRRLQEKNLEWKLVEENLIDCLVLLKYGLNTKPDSLLGDPEFASYLKHTIGGSFTWLRVSEN